MAQIAVIGRSTPPFRKKLLEQSAVIGRMVASAGHDLLSGACAGLPHAAVEAAFKEGGKTIGYSPAADREGHVKRYASPLNGFSQLHYYGDRAWSDVKNFTWRSAHLIDDADAVICVEGSWGTLSEISLVFVTEKPFGVLEGGGGAAGYVRDLEEKLVRRRKTPVLYLKDPEKLAELVFAEL